MNQTKSKKITIKILDNDNTSVTNKLKAEINNNRATCNYSAPPGLNFPAMMYNDQNSATIINDPDYYEFYFIAKNPRLPKPIKNYGQPFPGQQQQQNEKKNNEQALNNDFEKLNINGNTQDVINQQVNKTVQSQQPQQKSSLNQNQRVQQDIPQNTTQQPQQIIKPQIIQPVAQIPIQTQQQFKGNNNVMNYQQNMNQQQQYQKGNKQYMQMQYQQMGMVPNFANQQPAADFQSLPVQGNQQINKMNSPYSQQQMMGNYPQDFNDYNYMVYNQMYEPYQYYVQSQMNHQMYNMNRMNYNQQYFQGYNGQYGFNNKQAQKINQPREKINLKDLIDNLIENCKDQNGSRQIQLQFEQATEEEKDQIFDIIEKKALELMKDVFGNYVIQKLLEKGSEKHKKALFDIIKGNVATLSLHTYGCRVIQKALEELKDTAEMQDHLIDEINSKIMSCIQDQNGNHVIQKCFETLSPNKLKFIIKEVIDNIEQLAFHSYGCRVIQRILEFCSPDKVSETRQIYTKLMENLIKLCECQYGNYIMQYILEKGPLNEKEQILKVVKEHFVELSLNKFASNVTEKSILNSDQEFKKGVLKVLLRPIQGANENGLIRLTKDAYGNYVIQRLYEQSDAQTKQKMWQALKEDPEAVNELSKNNYGKHVLQYLDKSKAENGRLAPIQMQPNLPYTNLQM